MSKRNYSVVRERITDAICHELLRKDGHWPDVKAKVRELLGDDVCRLDELHQLADAASAAVLDCELVRVTEVRRKKNG